jgi:hypothetical protein
MIARALIRIVAPIWLLWFGLYGVISYGLLPRIHFFAETVDHVESFWVKIVFLNLPLQLVLAAFALALARPSPRTALAFAGLNSLLIAVHVTISVIIHLR